VADDTGTDWAALADKLLLWSDAANVFEDTDDDRDELRAAAVGLRRLAQLDTAIGDPGNLRLLADTFDLPILRRIADAAVLGSGEQPEATSIAARHQAHYRYCGCLGDSSECCDATCPCHSEARGEQPEGPTP